MELANKERRDMMPIVLPLMLFNLLLKLEHGSRPILSSWSRMPILHCSALEITRRKHTKVYKICRKNLLVVTK
jgi:hypothetical protein